LKTLMANTMESKQNMREELRLIVKGLKCHIAAGADSPEGLSHLYLKGEDPSESAFDRSLTLEEIRGGLGDCQRCSLHQARNNLVFGEGNPNAKLVFVGEAPGADEDRQGRPFVGRAGQLLTKIISAMGLTREEVYICNILKCRPPENRNPRPEEIQACEAFLIEQIRVIDPEVICALGTFAVRTLLNTDAPISSLRGKFHSYRGIKFMPTYHPAYLLRNPRAKKQVWEDVQMIMKELKV
jgi:uracil-DNA glycosylase family 4